MQAECIRKAYNKYKNVGFYVIFGVMTTIVNIVVYWLMSHVLNIKTIPSSVIAWVAAVLFAFFTNRKWVFHSENHTLSSIVKEMVWFFLCRLATGAIDWAFMYITVDLFQWNDLYMKFIANIIVVILNYVASKLVVFRKKKNSNEI